MNYRTEKEWVFSVPPDATGAFLRSMRASAPDSEHCEGTLHIEMREADGLNSFDCHVRFQYDIYKKYFEPMGGTILGGDTGQGFEVGKTGTEGRRSFANDHPLIEQFRVLLSDPRIMKSLDQFMSTRPI